MYPYLALPNTWDGNQFGAGLAWKTPESQLSRDHREMRCIRISLYMLQIWRKPLGIALWLSGWRLMVSYVVSPNVHMVSSKKGSGKQVIDVTANLMLCL